MKSLNKIIFINSAGIDYGEVRLDGNVHLTGTQGVGKSTILRAILFFYTADKEKRSLGLRPEKQGFEDFYLPSNNSYIAYEVTVEDFVYTILVCRSSLRASFRFIDAPFNPDWLITSDNHVRSEWSDIAHQLKGIHYTHMINYLYEYRTILFGKGAKREMARYSLIGCNDYDNITRSIQSVFLNDRIDSNFIRNTIITSLTSEPQSIDLKHWRNQLKSFKREYQDIRKWYTPGKDGKIVVREQANNVVEFYNSYQGYDTLLRTDWSKLNFAIARDEEQLPGLTKEIENMEGKVKTFEERLRTEKNRMEKERDDIKADLTRVKDFLKKCKDLRARYEEIDISEIEATCNEKTEIQTELEKLNKQHDVLVQEYQDIEARFEMQKSIESNALNQKLAKLNETQTYLNQEHIDKIMAINSEARDALLSIDNSYREKIRSNQEFKEAKIQELSELRSQLQRLEYIHPRQEEINNLKTAIRKAEDEKKDLQRAINSLADSISTMSKQRDLAVDKEDFRFNSIRQDLTEKLDSIHKHILELQQQLDSFDGSFYNWLEVNVPGWQETIGKVADERRVLLSHELYPELSAGLQSNSLFGVKIQINNIESCVLSPNELAKQLQESQTEETKIVKSIELAEGEHEQNLKVLRSEFVKKIEDLQLALNQKQAQFEQMPVRLVALQNSLRKTEDLDKKEIEQQAEAIRKSIDSATVCKDEACNNLQKYENAKDAEQKKQKRITDKVLNEENSAFEKSQEIYKAQRKRYQEEHDRNIAEIEAERQKALKGKGADTEAIKRVENGIKEQKKLLDYIEENEHYVIEYHKDMREYIVHEDEKKEERKRLEDKLNVVETSHKEKEQNYNRQISEAKNITSDLQSKLDKLQNGIKMANSLQREDSVIPSALKVLVIQLANDESCQNLCNNIRSTITGLETTKNKLGESSREFRSNFSPENTFQFPDIQFNDESVMAFAANVKHFIEDNLIDEYSDISNKRYTDHLLHLAREVGMLTRLESQVHNIINEINRGFDKDNFVSAIERIQLGIKEADSSIMSTLRSIQNFVNEHPVELGGPNLFSTDGDSEISRKEVRYLQAFIDALDAYSDKQSIEVSDTFKLQFHLVENGRDLGWQDRISNIGSDGTDILAKAMINIMLISVFMKRGYNGHPDYQVHCMMDEIGKLHPENVNGILNFASRRNIYLINCSPMTYNIGEYRYTYVLDKDHSHVTHVTLLLDNEKVMSNV